MKIAKFKEIRQALGMIFSVREAPIEEDVFVYLDEDLIYAAYRQDRTEVFRCGVMSCPSVAADLVPAS